MHTTSTTGNKTKTVEYLVTARSCILPVPEAYPSFKSTGLPDRPRVLVSPMLPNKYTENYPFPVQEFSAFAKLLNGSTNDAIDNDKFDKRYRFISQVKFSVAASNGKLIVTVIHEKNKALIETDFGVEKTPIKTFTPPPLRIEQLRFKPMSNTRFDFGWTVLGRPHWLSEPLFEEICHRDCVYIWHKVTGSITLDSGKIILSVGISGSRFPSHALFIDHVQTKLVRQGALGNLWISDTADPARVSATGSAATRGFSGFGGGAFGGGGSGSTW